MTGRGLFRADAPEGQRWTAGLQLLNEGKRIVTGDVVIDCADPNESVIEVCTAAFRRTKEQAERDLAEAQSHVESLRQASAEFDALLKSRTFRYVYVFDDDNTRVAIGQFTEDGTFDPKGP